MDATTAYALDEDHLLLDVREPDEWAAGHIPGALHVPMGDLNARQAELPEDRLIVVVCRSGNRSGVVTGALQRAGYQAENLEGGMQGWHAAGQPMEADGDHDPYVA